MIFFLGISSPQKNRRAELFRQKKRWFFCRFVRKKGSLEKIVAGQFPLDFFKKFCIIMLIG